MNFNKKVMSNYLIIIAAVLSILNCSDLSNPVISYDGALNGKWEEEFVWKSDLIVVFGGGEFQTNGMNKKSNINFRGNQFEVKILPPNRITSLRGDSTFVTFSSDTIYTGVYKIYGDTLKFYLTNQERPKLFSYQFYGDSLRILQLPKIDSSGFYTINITSFLWGYSDHKNAGVFIRKK